MQFKGNMMVTQCLTKTQAMRHADSGISDCMPEKAGGMHFTKKRTREMKKPSCENALSALVRSLE